MASNANATTTPAVPIRTPMFDGGGNMTRPWILFFQQFGATSTTATDINIVTVSGGSATPDLSLGGFQVIVLTADTLLNAPVNAGAGRTPWTLIVQQDATGGHSLTFDVSYTLQYSLSTAASPASTECVQDFVTTASGNTGPRSAPSIDQRIPT